ncbi:MAG: 4-fold beta flower protein [bacterium]
MEETLFDKDGTPVAYIDYNDESTIYFWDGTPISYLDEDNKIYGFNGKHLGWYEDGIIRNLTGEKNSFNSSSLPGYAKYEPYKSYKKYKPYKSKSIQNTNLIINTQIVMSLYLSFYYAGKNKEYKAMLNN